MLLSRRKLTTLGIMGGSFLAAIEATIVATAMPTVVEQLGGMAHYSWVFSAYLLASTVTVPVWGKLSDLYGRRPNYLVAVVLFLTGSALSGAAQSMPQLIAFRALQGVGAGGLVPVGMTILGDLFTLQERARVQGLFSGVWGLASIVGPLIGGYITEAISWRWVFYLNLPFGIAAALLVGLALVDVTPHTHPRIDYLGAALMSASVVVLLMALAQTGARDRAVNITTLAALYGIALLLGVIFMAIERRVPEPIVPLDLFADPLINAITICGFLVGIAIFGAISFVPLFVQSAMGGTATEAGSALTPLLLGWVVTAIVTGRLLPRTGYRPMLLAGLACNAVGFVGLTSIGRASPVWVLYASLAMMGVGMGMAMLTLLLAMQNAVPRERLGIATSISQFTRTIGGAVGVALMGTIAAATLPAGQATAAAMETALSRAFLAGTLASFAALGAALRVPAGLPLSRPAPITPPRGA